MELDPEARRILSLVDAERTPSADDKARVEQNLARALGASAGLLVSATASSASAAPPSLAAAKAAGSALALKWTLGGLAVLAGIAGYAAFLARPTEPAAKSPAPMAHAPTPAPALTPTPTPTLTLTPAATPTPAKTRPRHADGEALDAELSLLHAAQSAWRSGNAAQALTLVAQHRSRHPRSALALERDALRVLALCDLGRRREAAKLARAWLARAPGSPLRAAIEGSCAIQ
jgi:hypothetical protein